MKAVAICFLIVILNSWCEKLHFGPFKIKVLSVHTCKGPKARECGVADVKLWSDEKTMLYAKAVINQNLSHVHVNIAGYSGNSRRPGQRVNVKHVCDHVGLKLIFQTLLHITDNCVILKGTYENSLDMSSLSHKYFGEQFIYGNYTFKNTFFTDRCNHFCSIIKIQYLPL